MAKKPRNRLADFDPAGNQMAVSIGRKLQALRDQGLYRRLRRYRALVGMEVSDARARALISRRSDAPG